MDRDQIEQWFISRGVPHFIDGYDAARDIFTRSIPILIGLYLLSSLNALDIYRWSLVRNLVAVVGIVAMLLVAWAGSNRVRRRPWFERPRQVGRAELALFVVGPTVPSMVFGQQWGDVAQAAAENIVLLAAIYLGTSYAVIPLSRWALRHLVRQLASLTGLVLRALPLLLLIITFSFLGAEVWEMVAALPLVVFPAVQGLFLLTGGGFLLASLPASIRDIDTFASWDQIGELVASTPAAGVALPAGGVPRPVGLSLRERFNLTLVLLFAQGVQITLVTLTMGLFLTGLGVLTMGADTIANWTGQEPTVLFALDSGGGRQLVLTRELIEVSWFLAVITGFYFTVYLVTDQTYRQEFRADVDTELREALAVRRAYHHALASADPGPGAAS